MSMNLHLDKESFKKIIDIISKKTGVREDILEKDYYVTLLLEELSQKENQNYAYFKGGTALYKALRSIRRFSEDIDLTVCVEDCLTNNQKKKRLENATLKFNSLIKDDNDENYKGSITVNYLYDSMYNIDNNDALQRFGKVKIEATSFTVSEPITDMIIAPYLFELSDINNQKILCKNFCVKPFTIKTISLERIFIDKIFASQFYYKREKYGDVAKHIYDISILLENNKINEFLTKKDEVYKIIGYKRMEEEFRKGGISSDIKIKDFNYFSELKNNKDFIEEYNRMQKIYIFDRNDFIDVEKIFDSINKVKQIMESYDY